MSKNKILDWIERLRDRKMLTVVVSLISIILILTVCIAKKEKDYKQLSENNYNDAFYQLVEYVNNTEKLLAKATISSSDEQGIKNFTNLWNQATLAQNFLARLPLGTQDIENTQKFLNQVADYSYSLARKNISGEELTEEDVDNIERLHQHSLDLKNTVNQLETDLYSGNIKWGGLQEKGSIININDDSTKNSFGEIEENLHQYAGLIYDGAYSEHLLTQEKKGLIGEEKSKEEAEVIVKSFFGNEEVEKTQYVETTQNANIECYSFDVKLKNNETFFATISKKGGHVISINCNRDVEKIAINPEEAVIKGKEFLEKREFKNMKETYYMNEGNILTINYAYNQNDIVVYPDLIKVKVAMDNGEVLGMEATGYLNSHTERKTKDIKISKEDALKSINKDLEIKGCNLAIIPTEWNTEIECWEIKGRKQENDFIVFVNVETGKQEDILMIIDTPNGTLTT